MSEITFGQAVWTIIFAVAVIFGPLAIGAVLYRAGHRIAMRPHGRKDKLRG